MVTKKWELDVGAAASKLFSVELYQCILSVSLL